MKYEYSDDKFNQLISRVEALDTVYHHKSGMKELRAALVSAKTGDPSNKSAQYYALLKALFQTLGETSELFGKSGRRAMILAIFADQLGINWVDEAKKGLAEERASVAVMAAVVNPRPYIKKFNLATDADLNRMSGEDLQHTALRAQAAVAQAAWKETLATATDKDIQRHVLPAAYKLLGKEGLFSSSKPVPSTDVAPTPEPVDHFYTL